MNSLQEIVDVLRRKIVSLGDVTITPAVLLTIVLIMLAALWISQLLQRMLRRNLFRRMRLNEGTQATICRILHYVIMLVGLFMAVKSDWNQLDNLGCDKCSIDGRDWIGVAECYQ